MEWYEKLQRQCKVCRKYLAEELVKQSRDWFYWQCRFCGNKRTHERSWGMYKHKNGKTFLKARGMKKFVEVELIIKNGLPVIREVIPC